jgi:hypothetical protein
MLMEFAEENWNPAASKRAAKICVSEHVFDVRLCVIEVSVDGHNRGVVAFLRHHLFFSWMALTPFLG